MMKPTDMTQTTDEVIDQGPGLDDSVHGVNVMRVVDGKIIEAAVYSKTAPDCRRPGGLTDR